MLLKLRFCDEGGPTSLAGVMFLLSMYLDVSLKVADEVEFLQALLDWTYEDFCLLLWFSNPLDPFLRRGY